MAKDFQSYMQELASSVTLSGKGKAKKTFSRKAFEELFLAFLNENNYTTEVVQVKGGELVRVPVTPVAEFRRTFHEVLIDFGVDKAAAEAMLDGSYQFRKVHGAYEFVSEVLTNYLDSKSFTFLPKEDLTAVLRLDTIEETVKDFRVPPKEQGGPSGTVRKKVKKHRKMKVTSSAPEWAKIKIDE